MISENNPENCVIVIYSPEAASTDDVSEYELLLKASGSRRHHKAGSRPYYLLAIFDKCSTQITIDPDTYCINVTEIFRMALVYRCLRRH